jgi:alanine dehydrogenase
VVKCTSEFPKELKTHDYLVGLTPAGAASLRDAGHDVRVERSACVGSGFADEQYSAAGAWIV